MTRELFVARRVDGETGPSRSFAEHDANRDFDHLEDRQEPTPNLAHLRRALDEHCQVCSAVKLFVDQRIAHSDDNPSAAAAKWDELDRAIDAIGDLWNLASLLLTDSTRPCHVPVLGGDPDWEWALREPWAFDNRVSGDT